MSPVPEPRYFGPDERPLYGFLHRVSAPAASLGLVICNPFGYEAVCAHRSVKHIAVAAADAGVPSLRFDYDGTGDSAGDDRDPGRVAAWLASIEHAIDELRRITGVAKVCLLGIRIGALLAATVAARRDDVAGLVGFASCASGRAHLRELRALHFALGLPDAPPAARRDEGVEEAAGFALTAETRSALAELDGTKATARPAPHVLLLERADLRGNDAWAERLRTLGADVVVERVPGYVEMVLDPHKARVPMQMIERLVRWLRLRADEERAQELPAVEPRSSARFGAVVETASFLDEGVFAILSTPAALGASSAQRAIVLLNAGAVHHIGPNRMHVLLARRWAALGHAVLRVDLPGLGDGRVRSGRTENLAYYPDAVDDVATAIAFLRRRDADARVYLTGICSGAYHSFKAALADPKVDGVVPINQPIFFWKEGMSLDTAPAAVVLHAQRSSPLDLAKWKRLFRGESDARLIARLSARRAVSAIVRGARAVARRAGRALPRDVATELDAIVRRGVELRFVYASDEPGLALLRLEAGSTVSALAANGGLDVETLEGPDHTFTALWAQDALITRLGQILDPPPR